MTQQDDKKWEQRFKWLASQYWVEEEVVFRLGLEDTEYLNQYLAALVCAIDAKVAE